MKNMKQIISIVTAIAAIGIGALFVNNETQPTDKSNTAQSTTQNTAKGNRVSVELERVVDGDTIIMKDQGERKRMRLLLIDTPESNTKKTGSVQPYGVEAKKFLTDYLKGKKLEIEYDPKQDKVDQYDRTLAYLYADNELVEEVMLKEGLARLGYYDGDELYFQTLKDAETTAKNAKKNIWSIKDYVGSRGFNEK